MNNTPRKTNAMRYAENARRRLAAKRASSLSLQSVLPRLGAGAVAGLLLLLAAAPVAAQEPLTLVSNLEQSGASNAGPESGAAQNFTTGGHVTGYTVTNLWVRINSLTDGAVDPNDTAFDVEIHTTDASGFPDTRLYTLIRPASLTAGGSLNTFMARALTILEPHTTYAAVFVHVSGHTRLALSSSHAEDAASQSDWSIGARRATWGSGGQGTWRYLGTVGSAQNIQLGISGYLRNLPSQSNRVANGGQSQDGMEALGNDTDALRAQAFTTGGNANGYALSSVQIRTAANTNLFDVRIFSTRNGVPLHEIGRLNPPGSIGAGGYATWSLPSGLLLNPNTTYAVVMQPTGMGGGGPTLLDTTSNAEDSGGSTDWSIANVKYASSDGGLTWSSVSGRNLMITVRAGDSAAAPRAISVSAAVRSNVFNEVEEGRGINVDLTPSQVPQSPFTVDWTIAPTGANPAADEDFNLDTNPMFGGRTGDGRSGTATIAAGPYGLSPRTIRIEPFDDANDEVNETFTLALTTTASYVTLPAAADIPVITIIDNDGAPGSRTFVSNLLNTRDCCLDVQNFGALAQGFTTGSNAAGYTLESVGLYINLWDNSPQATVGVYSRGTGGFPDTLIATLTNPATVTAGQINLWTAPANIMLSPSTPYLVQIAVTSGMVRVPTSTLNAIDASPLPGWNIERTGNRRRSTGGAWTDPTGRGAGMLIMAVNGAVTPPPPPPTDPAPTDPAPTDPAPTDPAPTNPAPTDPAPTNPAPTDPAPTNPAPTDPAPTNPAPTIPVAPPPPPPPARFLTVSERAITVGEARETTYEVELGARPTGDVTVTPASADTTVATVAPKTLAFTRDDWDTPQTVTVSGVNDRMVNADVRMTAVSHSAQGGGYNLNLANRIVVTVTDYVSGVSAEANELPTEVGLFQNYPNPFNPRTTIEYALPQAGDVRLVVYDMLGQEVAVLHDGPKPAGRHAARFHADHLPNGAYVYRLAAGGETLTRTMTLAK